jgi:hypothetical protein
MEMQRMITRRRKDAGEGAGNPEQEDGKQTSAK